MSSLKIKWQIVPKTSSAYTRDAPTGIDDGWTLKLKNRPLRKVTGSKPTQTQLQT
ncbi:hypothetical protein [Maribacter sp. 2-571]|uniref:hypothetical protein n=1 Tax=Maribacter sp. 2-571 TaxID=3417569 RepID=UPI003D33A6CB